MNFRMYIWAKDDQKTMLTTLNGQPKPIQYFSNIQKHQVLNQPESHSMVCNISDFASGMDVGGGGYSSIVGKGVYYEIWYGFGTDTGYQPSGFKLYMSGYVTDIQEVASKQNELQISGASAMLRLATFCDTNNLEMDFVTDDPTKKGYSRSYMNMLDSLNGIYVRNAEGQGSASPHTKGILTGTGWNATWVQPDGQTPPYNKIPGYGDSWYTAWETALINVDTQAQHYNLFFREKTGSQATRGTIEIGPLRDPAKDSTGNALTIWGGDPLLKLEQSDPRFANLERPDANVAQTVFGVSVIQAAQYEDNTKTLVNTAWGLGRGTHASLTTIAPVFPPITSTVNGQEVINSQSSFPNAKYDYYFKYQENGPDGTREYWKVNDTYRLPHDTQDRPGLVTGNGLDYQTTDSFRLVATQNQDGTYAYGVMDETSTSKYGIREGTLVDKKTNDWGLLLSETLGLAATNADPVPTWVFPVQHPMVDNVFPPAVRVGQRLDVQFEGVVHDAISMDSRGMWTGQGAYTYLKFPTQADANSQAVVNGVQITPPMYEKSTMLVDVVEQWSGQMLVCTYTMGKGKFRKHHWVDDIARQFTHFVNAPQGHTSYQFKKTTLDDIHFLYAYGASVDLSTQTVKLPPGFGTSVWNSPGGVMVSDVQVDRFFDDNHGVKFNFVIRDDRHILDFWFAKTIEQELPNWQLDAGYQFGMFRIAMPKSGWKTGFFIQNGFANGSTDPKLVYPQPVGKRMSKEIQQNGLKKNITYTAHVTWHGGTFKAYLMEHDPKSKETSANRLAAIWQDKDKKITTYGAIGWHSVTATGGENADETELWAIDAHSLHHSTKAAIADSNGDGQTYETASQGGMQHRTYSDGSNRDFLSILATPDGHGGFKGSFQHGPIHVHDCALSTAVTAGTTVTTIADGSTIQAGASSKLDISQYKQSSHRPHNLPGGIPPMSVKVGDVIAFDDGDNSEPVTVNEMDTSHGGWITAIYTSPVQYSHAAGITLWWDNLANQRGSKHSTFFYTDPTGKNPKRTGLATIISSADTKGNEGLGLIIFADGSIGATKATIDPQGNIISLGELATTGSSMAKKLERAGRVMFDAGQRWSTTQEILPYSGATAGTAITANSLLADGVTSPLFDVGPYVEGTTGASVPPFDTTGVTGSQGSWVANTTSGDRGISDEILQLTTTSTYPTVVYQDNQIISENISSSYINKGTTSVAGTSHVTFYRPVAPWSFEVGARIDVDTDPTKEEYVTVSSISYDRKNNITGFTATFANPHGSNTQVSWYTREHYHLEHDLSFEIPVYIDNSDPSAASITDSQTLTMGDSAILSDDVQSSATQVTLPITGRVDTYPTVPGDTWMLNAGQPNAEQVVIAGINTVANGLIVNSLQNNHSEGEVMYLYMQNGSATVLQAPAALDGTTTMDQSTVPSGTINNISIGFYCHYRDSNPHNYYLVGGTGIGNQQFTLSSTAGGAAVNAGLSVGSTLTIYGHNEEVVPITAVNTATNTYTARFGSVHSASDPVAYYTSEIKDKFGWFRGWWGDPSWNPSFVNAPSSWSNPDGTAVGPAFINGKQQKMIYLGPLSATPNQWSGLAAKASQLNLIANTAEVTSVHLSRVRIIGIEMAVDGPSNYSVFFDAHQHGGAGHPGQIPARSIKDGHLADRSVTGRHKNPSSFADMHAHSDFTFWMEQWHQTGNADNNYWYIHWEHPVRSGEADKQAQIILTTGKKTVGTYPVYAGPSRSGNGAASEAHPNYGILCMPINKPSTADGSVSNTNAGTVTPLGITDNANSTDPTQEKNVRGHYLVFNSAPYGYWVQDKGVVGGQTWIPPYVKGSPSQQTSGFAIVTEHFDWGDDHNSGAVLAGPRTNLFKLGKLEYQHNPHTGEIGLAALHPNHKTQGSKTRRNSQTRKANHTSNAAIYNHHGLVYFLDSLHKGPNGTNESTFHCNLVKKGQSGTIVSHDNTVLATITKNYYINHVAPNWWIVYDDGKYHRYNDPADILHTAGFYAFADTWAAQQTWMGTNTDTSVHRFYKNGYFDLNNEETMGMYIIGQVSQNKDKITHQHYIEGHHPRAHQAAGHNHGKKSIHPKHYSRKSSHSKTRKKKVKATAKHKTAVARAS